MKRNQLLLMIIFILVLTGIDYLTAEGPKNQIQSKESQPQFKPYLHTPIPRMNGYLDNLANPWGIPYGSRYLKHSKTQKNFSPRRISALSFQFDIPAQLPSHEGFASRYFGLTAISGDSLLAVWIESGEGIFSAISSDSGQTWSSITEILHVPAFNGKIMKSMEERIWYFYYGFDESFNLGLYGLYSDTEGAIWNEPVLISDPFESVFIIAPVYQPDGTIQVYYSRWNSILSEYDIVLRESTDGGLTWSLYSSIIEDPGHQVYVDAVVDSFGTTWLFFDSDTGASGDYDIWFSVSDDGGATWSNSEVLVSTPTREQFPAALIDTAGSIIVAYSRNDTAAFIDLPFVLYDPNIYLMKSTDSGLSFISSI